MEANPKSLLLQEIGKWESRTNWNAVPASMQADRVHWLYEQFRKSFCPRRDIRQRIKASKATTFQELREAVAE